MWKCDRCLQYKCSHEQICKCKKFKITHDDEEYTLYADGNHDAAELYAKEYNENGDYNLMDTTIEITVFDVERELTSTFVVGAEPDIYYHVTETTE